MLLVGCQSPLPAQTPPAGEPAAAGGAPTTSPAAQASPNGASSGAQPGAPVAAVSPLPGSGSRGRNRHGNGDVSLPLDTFVAGVVPQSSTLVVDIAPETAAGLFRLLATRTWDTAEVTVGWTDAQGAPQSRAQRVGAGDGTQPVSVTFTGLPPGVALTIGITTHLNDVAVHANSVTLALAAGESRLPVQARAGLDFGAAIAMPVSDTPTVVLGETLTLTTGIPGGLGITAIQAFVAPPATGEAAVSEALPLGAPITDAGRFATFVWRTASAVDFDPVAQAWVYTDLLPASLVGGPTAAQPTACDLYFKLWVGTRTAGQTPAMRVTLLAPAGLTVTLR
jgi:hypothetical protein